MKEFNAFLSLKLKIYARLGIAVKPVTVYWLTDDAIRQSQFSAANQYRDILPQLFQ